MIVIDASVAIKWFVAEDGREQAMSVFSLSDELAAPDLVILETTNVLRRKCRMGLVTQRQVQDACQVMPRCFDRLIAASHLIDEALRLSITLDHSIYDCAYLACARMLDTRMLTADDRFFAKVTRIGSLSGHATRLATF